MSEKYFIIFYYILLYFTIFYYILLYFTIFYYILLYFTIFYYILLYFTIFYYILLYSAIFYYILLYFTIFYYILLYFTIFYYILLYFTIFYYILLYFTIFCYLSNPQNCQCNISKFCYEPHDHIITGDLMVIENVKLRELVAKGPKYREPNKINWQSTETMIQTPLISMRSNGPNGNR